VQTIAYLREDREALQRRVEELEAEVAELGARQLPKRKEPGE
jgi:BMFP domain-containing protein YqiC